LLVLKVKPSGKQWGLFTCIIVVGNKEPGAWS